MIMSALSILKATMTINVFNALLVNFKEGYLPFFCHALLFRVLSFAFIWVYLDRVVIVVFLLILVSNLSIGYRVAPTIKLPKELEGYLLRDSKGSCPPLWLNSFLSIIAPSWYLNIVDVEVVKKSMDNNLEQMYNRFSKTYITRITRRQIISSTAIIWISVGIIAIVVNLTDKETFNYLDNIFDSTEFNLFCIVLAALGALGLVFLIDTNIFNMASVKKDEEENYCLEYVISKNKKFGVFLRIFLTIAAVLLILSPVIVGLIYNDVRATTTGQ